MPSANNIVLGYGKVYLSTTLAEALPADTVAKGGSWGGTWVDLGYTRGVQSGINYEQRDVEVDQSTMDVRSYITKQEVMIETTLVEATLQNLKYALGWGTLSTSGSTAVLQLADNPTSTEVSIGLEGQSPNAAAEFRRVQIYRCVPQSDIELIMSREEETLWKAKFKALLYTSGSSTNNVMQIRDYTD